MNRQTLLDRLLENLQRQLFNSDHCPKIDIEKLYGGIVAAFEKIESKDISPEQAKEILMKDFDPTDFDYVHAEGFLRMLIINDIDTLFE